MRKLAIFGLAMVFSLSACTKSEETGKKEGKPAGEAVTAGADTLLGGFDPAAEIKSLQGTWEVRDSLSARSTWEISGNKLKRTFGDKTEEGTIKITGPGQVAFVQEKGGGTETIYYGFSRDGEDIYIGLGKAGVKKGDRYMLAVYGLLVMQGAACKYYERDMFQEGFKKEGVEVRCQLKQEGDQQVLAYETPDRFQKGEMRPGTVNIRGQALLDDQMMGNRATRVK